MTASSILRLYMVQLVRRSAPRVRLDTKPCDKGREDLRKSSWDCFFKQLTTTIIIIDKQQIVLFVCQLLCFII